jgi:hypothetical protein
MHSTTEIAPAAVTFAAFTPAAAILTRNLHY